MGARAFVLGILLAACSDAGEPAANVSLPVQSIEIVSLTEAELLEIPRNEVVRRSPVSRNPVPAGPGSTDG